MYLLFWAIQNLAKAGKKEKEETMTTWDDTQDWDELMSELRENPHFHVCRKWEEKNSFYLDGKFFEVLGFGADGGPNYNEDTPEILDEAGYCLFCGTKVKPAAEIPLLQDQPHALWP